ncbi:MAG: tryptophan synthase subunit alpha [Gammaproteobacteria bacterium]|nr:tryptophan synthase subunit alpha [Gammaproteobacteria bacterium]
MSRIAQCFADAKASQRKLLITYQMGGDPGMQESLELMHEMVRAGTDIIELGMPFSDPMADGPVIQAASERVLGKGVRLRHIFELVESFRKTDQKTPLVLMGYANPIEIMGYGNFADRAAAAGVDGVITVDMPPEEATLLSEEFAKRQLDPIFLLSPTTPDSRTKEVCKRGSGFIYYVSLKGVTGSAKLDTGDVAEKVSHIKQLSDMPVAVGFGISDPDSAARVAEVADAVVVGSAIVKRIAEHGQDRPKMLASVVEMVAGLRAAIDR